MNLLTFFRDRREARASKLYDEGWELIEERSFGDALKIGRKLRKLNFIGAFEIEGLAYAGLDRHGDAVRVLREGLALAPAAWPNWQLLGSCLSDLQRYDEALLAYDRAEACEGSDLSQIDLNRAIVASRQNDHERSLQLLDKIRDYESREIQLRAISQRVRALHGLGRDGEAEDLGTRTLNVWRDASEDEGQNAVASIASEIALIRQRRGDDRKELLAFAIDWWQRTRNESLLWTIREVRMERSINAKHFNLRLHAPGVYLGVDAVADSPEEALAFVRELEPEPFAIDDVKSVAPADQPKGIYYVSARVFYEETTS